MAEGEAEAAGARELRGAMAQGHAEAWRRHGGSMAGHARHGGGWAWISRVLSAEIICDRHCKRLHPVGDDALPPVIPVRLPRLLLAVEAARRAAPQGRALPHAARASRLGSRLGLILFWVLHLVHEPMNGLG